MKYCELYKEFIAMFPEDCVYFSNRCKEVLADEEDGMHVMFGMVVTPYIRKCINENSDNLHKIFEFIEKMETSEDRMIAEVAEISILEDLITKDKMLLETIQKFAGSETILAIKELSKWYK